MYQIDNDIRIQDVNGKGGGLVANHIRMASPWRDMEVGQSFFVPNTDYLGTIKDPIKIAGKVRSSAMSAARELGCTATSRTVYNKDFTEVLGVRFWLLSKAPRSQ